MRMCLLSAGEMGMLLLKMCPVPTCQISWVIGTYWACLGMPGHPWASLGMLRGFKVEHIQVRKVLRFG